jgi:hypothetical protein
MKKTRLGSIAAILTLAACGTHDIRCDRDLQPINAPRAKATPESPSSTHPPMTSQPASAPASDRREVTGTPGKATP